MVNIREINASDEPVWRQLWRGYLEFYKTSLTDDVYRSTFSRLLDSGAYEPSGFLALSEGVGVGLVHYMQHRQCWGTENVCFLQDLYVSPEARGLGVGRALIQAVYAEADQLGLASVYWHTAEDNATARMLYDKVARKTPFIKYQR